jgi:hypothetical protein
MRYIPFSSHQKHLLHIARGPAKYIPTLENGGALVTVNSGSAAVAGSIWLAYQSPFASNTLIQNLFDNLSALWHQKISGGMLL